MRVMSFPTIPFSLLGSTTPVVSGMPYFAALNRVVTNPTFDVGIFFALFAGGLFWAFAAGRRAVVSSIMMTYVALAIFAGLPLDRLIALSGVRDRSFAAIGIFAILFLLLVFLLGARRGRGFSVSGPWWQTLVLSFLQMGFLMHIGVSFLSDERTASLSPLVRRVFADSDMHLWWLVAPIAFLIIIRRLAMRDD